MFDSENCRWCDWAVLISFSAFEALMVCSAFGLFPDDTHTQKSPDSCQVKQQTQTQLNSVQSQLYSVRAQLAGIEHQLDAVKSIKINS